MVSQTLFFNNNNGETDPKASRNVCPTKTYQDLIFKLNAHALSESYET